MAPRPHNSGHYTIEACFVSQYEQHLRAVLGLPLGDPSMKVPAALMYNLLGEDEVGLLLWLIDDLHVYYKMFSSEIPNFVAKKRNNESSLMKDSPSPGRTKN